MIVSMLLLFFLAGCAHTQVVSWEGNKFKVCGNNWAKRTDYDKVADQRCESGYRALAGGVENTGDYTFSGGEATANRRSCLVYECTSE